ncbi:Swt1 family HEPN domain-containing protein [Solibaculum intestinale]|uniref:Swt1 family HEPN domain-containing protein n=1 Tax=Solibaculum intestinale TaxID=3133165 RepID=A0ABV1E2H9_9FIRM
MKDSVNNLKKQEEKNKYHSNRSSTEIGYTMLGNLGQIIIANWDDFSDIIPNQAWLTSRMDNIEMSRNIIMHTGVLPIDEIERIESIVRDLLRQIG